MALPELPSTTSIAVLLSLALAGCTDAMRPGAPSGSLGLYAEPWQWTTDAGLTFRFNELRGQPVVLSAIYTNCTGSCPLTLARMKTLELAVKARNLAAHFVLVTLDPAHDTAASLADYRRRNQLDATRWIMLRGDTPTTDALARRLSVHRIDDGAHLLHVSRTMILDREGSTLGLWSEADAGEALAVLTRSEPTESR
ncbi:MAG: SCO family protein [Methylotetracoccus sp.]